MHINLLLLNKKIEEIHDGLKLCLVLIALIISAVLCFSLYTYALSPKEHLTRHDVKMLILEELVDQFPEIRKKINDEKRNTQEEPGELIPEIMKGLGIIINTLPNIQINNKNLDFLNVINKK